ncbi:hypothetical protein ACFL6G_07590 [candidate division KSB1 bacterium]
MKTLKKTFPIKFYLFASPVYWKNKAELDSVRNELANRLTGSAFGEFISRDDVILVDSEEGLDTLENTGVCDLAVFIPMSGGVQPWMLKLSERFDIIALANAYLPGRFIDENMSSRLLALNAHPACTDLYANLKMRGKNIYWIFSLEELTHVVKAWQAVQRLKNARILKIGETEPWVINSCRDPEIFRNKLGVEVIPVESSELYDLIHNTSKGSSKEIADKWIKHSSELKDVGQNDVIDASRIIVGINKLVEKYNADGLSLACFSMIKDIDTTGCLALSYLNSSDHSIGACEGDLDAAVSLFLLKALDEDFVWMGNPVIYEDNSLDITHCTAAFRCCGADLKYSLLPHHESGRSVAVRVEIPEKKHVSMMRIGNDLDDIFIGKGTTNGYPGLQSCRTQTRIEVSSSKAVFENLMGTHLVICLNDRTTELGYCADFLNLNKKLVL